MQPQRHKHHPYTRASWALGALLGLAAVLTGCEHPNDAPDDVTRGVSGVTQLAEV